MNSRCMTCSLFLGVISNIFEVSNFLSLDAHRKFQCIQNMQMTICLIKQSTRVWSLYISPIFFFYSEIMRSRLEMTFFLSWKEESNLV